MGKKTYCLDTSVLINNPNAIEEFVKKEFDSEVVPALLTNMRSRVQEVTVSQIQPTTIEVAELQNRVRALEEKLIAFSNAATKL